MFLIPLSHELPTSFLTDYKTKNFPHQLSPHFMKLDEATGALRELTIDDNLEMLKRNNFIWYGDQNDGWQYFNLRDVLFYMRKGIFYTGTQYQANSNVSVFTRNKEKYYAIHTNTDSRSWSYDYQTSFFTGIPIAPRIVHVVHNGLDYLLPVKLVNWKTFDLIDSYWVNTDTAIATMLAKITELVVTKYALATSFNANMWFRHPTDGRILIGNQRDYYMETDVAILIDGKTAFPDCVITGSTKIYNLLNEFGTDTASSKNRVLYRGAAGMQGIIPVTHEDYYNYDKTKIIGKDASGKFDIYDLNYMKSLYTGKHTILEPVHKFGLAVSRFDFGQSTNGNSHGSNSGSFAFRNIANFTINDKNPPILNGFGIDCIILNNNRAIKNRNTHRGASYATGQGNQYIRNVIAPFIFIQSNDLNQLSFMVFNTGYINTLFKNAEVYRTPKNKDFDYFTITDAEADYQPKLESLFGSETNYEQAYQAQSLILFQRGFSGKSFLNNTSEWLELVKKYGTYGQTATNAQIIDTAKCYDFRDFNALTLFQGNFVRQNNKGNDSPNQYMNCQIRGVGTTDINVVNNKTDNVLVDAIFDHYCEIFHHAPIYIVDINILKTFGLDTEYHKYMPDRCIWFEVDDLYIYTADGKIEGFNLKYVDGTSQYKFIYNLQQFTKFKARYAETVKEVLWDTRKTSNTDFCSVIYEFTYTTTGNTTSTAVNGSTFNKIYSDTIGDIFLSEAYYYDEFYCNNWLPLQKAVFRLDGIELNTAMEPEQGGAQ